MNNYIILTGDETSSDYTFKDLKNIDNVKFVYKNKCFKSRIVSLLFSINFSQKVNRYFHPITKNLFFSQLFKQFKFENKGRLVVIFLQGWYDKKFLEWLKKKHPDVVKVLYCYDTVGFYAKHIPSMNPELLGKEFDFVLCYNPDDAEKYGYIHENAYFSKLPLKCIPRKNKCDISFIGQAKDRFELIGRLYKKLSSRYDVGFYVAGVASKDRKIAGINYLDRDISYTDYLGIEISSDCIVELVKGDTKGCTFRAWEAVYYNKKLLTNWKGIKEFKYYNPKFMQYFQDPEEIDMSFFDSDVVVDYKYMNDNSPIHLIETLDRLIWKMK